MFGFIAVSWFLTFGYVPGKSDFTGFNTSAESKNVRGTDGTELVLTVAEIGFNAKAWDRLEVYTDIENWQFTGDTNYPTGFFPVQAKYTIGARYEVIKGLTLGAEHWCQHAVTSYGTDVRYRYGGRETRFTVTIHGETK